jgi:type III pantothenate kinase
VILLVDAGNTRIKWRVVNRRELLGSGSVSTLEVARLAMIWRPYRLHGALLSCVAAEAVRAALAEMLAAAGIPTHWLVAEQDHYGVRNLYDMPEQLGADRYAALIAAARLKLGDCVVASIGTATTIDRLDRHGAFLGGVILPGPDLMRAALLGGTAQIETRMQTPLAGSIAGSITVTSLETLPRDTASAVGAGIAMAQAGAIAAVCALGSGSEPAQSRLILTGGARGQVRDSLRMEWVEIDDLVLDGLSWVALESPWAS